MKKLQCNNKFAEFDYFGEGRDDFYNKFTVNSILVQGEHWRKPPMITILLNTYKRPNLLKQALESALNQKGFDDYQVLVLDNEGEDIYVQTETSKLMSEYANNDKVIYYRNEKILDTKFDSAVRLARSEWICSLHDDDFLAENHLVNMVNIVKKHPEIKYLTCRVEKIDGDISDNKIQKILKARKGKYKVVKYSPKCTCIGHYSGWHGALIKRKLYISIGGMPSINMGCGDIAMVYQFMRKYGIYEIETETPFYFYREWKGQISNTNCEERIRILNNLYCFYVYNNRKYHKFTKNLWNRVSQYLIINCAMGYKRLYHLKLDFQLLVNECGLEKDILDNNIKKYIICKFIECYKSLNKPRIIQKTEEFIV